MPIINLDQVTQRFGGFTALHDITLCIESGIVGILGPNGAGKSTILKIIMGLLSPTSGSGTILGHRIGARIPVNHKLRQQIGYMPEAEGLVPGLQGVEYISLAGELCGMPRRQAQRRAHELLTYLELGEARYRPLEDYSTGMKQRIKLAQALIHDPQLVLLDEPTSGLDPAGRDAMLKLLQNLGKDFGKSMLISTHLLADVETMCDTIVILLAGKIRGQGSVDSLRDPRANRYKLRLENDDDRWRELMSQSGILWREKTPRGDWRVAIPHDYPIRQLFQTAQANGVLIRGLQRDEETLEELFLRLAQPDGPLMVRELKI